MSRDGYLPPGVEYSDIPGINGAQQLFSNCCGAADRAIAEDSAYYSDIGCCPRCHEHCTFVTEAELE